MPDFLTKITIDPERMQGRPCIRGLRLTAPNVLASQADHPIVAAEL
jgi:uncharacterized protein (DUF433 family)